MWNAQLRRSNQTEKCLSIVTTDRIQVCQNRHPCFTCTLNMFAISIFLSPTNATHFQIKKSPSTHTWATNRFMHMNHSVVPRQTRTLPGIASPSSSPFLSINILSEHFNCSFGPKSKNSNFFFSKRGRWSSRK